MSGVDGGGVSVSQRGVPTRGGDRHAKWPWYMETIPALSGRKSGTIKPWAKGANDDVVGL